jgi:DNA-binding winged helix-turn-helix (wHTH) protein/tetratricopeptide (TPR) repeat protein
MDQPTARRQIVFRPFHLDLDTERLMRGSSPVPLTPKAFAVLHFLVARSHRLVTKEEILGTLWAGTNVQDAVLKVCIAEIRKALGDRARAPRYIETSPRRGYRFVGTIDGRSRRDPAPRRAGLVGRGPEMARLEGWLENARRGERQVVFVTGEGGIGKTAVVQSLLDRAASAPGTWVARGACVEQYGSGEPYLPVLEGIGRLARGPHGDRLVALLRRHAPTWLAQMPSLLRETERESLGRETIGATGERMVRELAEAVEAFDEETTLVLALEDLQWSDFSTLDLISCLARRREPAGLMLIGTYRPADVLLGHHPLRAVTRELRMRRQCHELPLGYLSQAEVAEYLAGRFPETLAESMAGPIHRRTGGNPLFMVNVVDYLAGRDLIGTPGARGNLAGAPSAVESVIPESLREMIEKQLDRLTDEEQGLLEAASVAGLEFPALAVAAGLEIDLGRSEAICDGLARRGQFLRPTGVRRLPDGTVTARYEFIHPLYQNVLYHRLPPARRLRLHQRIAERGITVYGPRAGEIAAELAVHFERAGDIGGAVDQLRRAADNASRRYANREAIEHLTRAYDLVDHLPEPDRGDLQMMILEQVGTTRRSMGDMQGAAGDFEALVGLARERGRADREARGLFYLGSAVSWFDRGHFQRATEQALALAHSFEDGLLRAHTRGYSAYWSLLLRGWRQEDADASAAAIGAARQSGDRLLLSQHVGRSSYFQCLRSRYDAGCEAAQEGMRLALEVGDAFDFLLCRFFLAWGLLHAGRWGEALAVLEEGIRLAERNGHHLWATLLRLEMAWLHEQAHDFEPARRLCEQALEVSRERRHAHSRLVGVALLGRAHLGLGHPERALHWSEEAGGPGERERGLMDWSWQMPIGLCLAEQALAAGDLARARAEADRVRSLAAVPGERTYLALAGRVAARIAAAEGDTRKAEAEIGGALGALEGIDAPLAAWQVCATAARIHREAGRLPDAEACRSRSATVIQGLAGSLDPASDLRASFLASAAVREVLDAPSA